MREFLMFFCGLTTWQIVILVIEFVLGVLATISFVIMTSTQEKDDKEAFSERSEKKREDIT